LCNDSQLWVYPIKALRGIRLDKADLGPQGIKYDRHFMLCQVTNTGELKKLQLSGHPECALFSQEIVQGSVHVRYVGPPSPEGEDQTETAHKNEHDEILEVPLEPSLDGLVIADVNLHNSLVKAYRMGSPYDEWFSACFGFETALMYIGDGRRPVLGTFSPRVASQSTTAASKGWLSSISSFVGGTQQQDEPDWLAFSDCAPYLIATEASLSNVSRRLQSGEMEMVKFRPNIVVDGEGEWEEDYWIELAVSQQDGEQPTPTFALSKMCNRCSSVNVDYDTGRIATGEYGTVLKKLMSDRRVDEGYKYSPVFGRYAFLADGVDQATLRVGDTVRVNKASENRPVWDWPMKSNAVARYYNQRV
jgi:uncharacterized protein YcbX